MSEPETINNQNRDEPVQEEQPQGWGSKIYRAVFIYFIISFVSKMFSKEKNSNPEYNLENILKHDTEFNVNFYIHKSKSAINPKNLKFLSPIATIKNIKYTSEGNSSFVIQTDLVYDLNVENLSEEDLKDTKLFLYSEIDFPETERQIKEELLVSFKESDGPFFQSINILKYSENLNEMIKQRDMMNDMEVGSMQHDESDLTTKNKEEVEKDYVKNLYYKPELTLYLLSMEREREVGSFDELRILRIPTHMNMNRKLFVPQTYLTDFWTMNSELQPLEKSTTLKVKVEFRFLTMFFFKNMRGVEINSEMMENSFHLPGSKDMFVELLKNNSMTYLSIMFTVNILHTLFSALGFASDVSYYKNLKQLDGVYTKHLFFHIFQMFVAILYVGIEGSHFLVKFELAIGLAIELWKLKKIFTVEFKMAFPFISIKYKIGFKLQKSKDYETEAVNLMLKYLFIPIAVIYLSYRIYYFKQRLQVSIFKFIIEYVFFLMNLFGFVLLTPQIYLNYKLKSVQHMPFKALTFKFLNTIIDDLYAFAVKTPTLYRIFCFKDDVIFVIFIYQIIKYRNNKRVSSDEEEELEEVKKEAIENTVIDNADETKEKQD